MKKKDNKLRGAIDGVPFKKGDSRINRKGRPEKFISSLKALGYTKSEVTDCILVLYSMKLSELQEISTGQYEKKDATMLEITCARAILKDAKNGDTKNLDMLLNRSLGAPKGTVENINSTSFSLSDEERERIANSMKNADKV